MNARQARTMYATGPRPLNVGTVFQTVGESTTGGRPGSLGIITDKLGDDRFQVIMYNGNRGIIYGAIIEAV